MNEAMNISEKRILPTFLLFLVLSWPLGAHRFIWWIIDFILIVTGSMKDDKGKLVKLWVD
jgi:hypothetical protein